MIFGWPKSDLHPTEAKDQILTTKLTKETPATASGTEAESYVEPSKENTTVLRNINTQEIDRYWLKNSTRSLNDKMYKIAIVLIGQTRNFPFDWQYKDQINDHLLAPFREEPDFDVHVIMVIDNFI